MLYNEVMQSLKSRIDSDEFKVGDVLPTEKALIEYYQVSRITIRKAVDELVKIGLVKKRQGAGTTIMRKTMVTSLMDLRSTSEHFSGDDYDLQYKVAEFNLIVPDDKIRTLMELDINDKVYFIRRHKVINGIASIYEDSYMPLALFPQMNIQSLQGSKYRYLEQELGFEIDGALQDFEAIMPDPDMCQVLDLDSTQPILRIVSLGRLKNGRVFEYTKIAFKPDTYSYKHYLKR